jgi:hypothetical protein
LGELVGVCGVLWLHQLAHSHDWLCHSLNIPWGLATGPGVVAVDEDETLG